MFFIHESKLNIKMISKVSCCIFNYARRNKANICAVQICVSMILTPCPAFPFPKQLPSSSHVSKETLLRCRERGVFYRFLSQCFIGLAQMNLSILTCSTRHLLLNGTETKYLCVMGSYWFWSWSGNLLFHKQFSWFTLVPPRKFIEKSTFFEDVTSTFLQLRTI